MSVIRDCFLVLCVVGWALSAGAAQNTAKPARAGQAGDLAGMSASLQEVVSRVSASVVQISATGFNIIDGGGNGKIQAFSRERGIGSGVVLSSDGLILTNAHVVEGAHRIRIRLKGVNPGEAPAGSQCGNASVHCGERVLEAKLVGADRFSDLALLKVDSAGRMPYLEIRDPDDLRQGEIVLAFGSPLGLENSVSMGIVSSVARQIARDDPHVYIQTDAAINPGNSGGPLVDTRGRLVGINTFIMSQSGGSEGVGFAVPADMVRSAFTQLRAQGRVRRGQVGVFVKALTPELSAGLKLSRSAGVLIEDVTPGGAADRAGLRIGDILLAFGGKPIADVPQFAKALFQAHVGEMSTMEVLRGTDRVMAFVLVEDRRDDPQGLADPVSEDSVVPKLGVVAMTVNREAAVGQSLRIPSGVVVAARTSGALYLGEMPEPGDVIHAVNNQPIGCLEDLLAFLACVSTDAPLVLQVERRGEMYFLVLETS